MPTLTLARLLGGISEGFRAAHPSEGEKVLDTAHLLDIISTYRARDLLTAFDDFGAGFSGLNLLADFQPDFVKLDMGLVRGVDHDKPRRAAIRHVAALCRDLDIKLIAEGVETADELKALRDLGIDLFQAFYFAKPRFEGLTLVDELLNPPTG